MKYFVTCSDRGMLRQSSHSHTHLTHTIFLSLSTIKGAGTIQSTHSKKIGITKVNKHCRIIQRRIQIMKARIPRYNMLRWQPHIIQCLWHTYKNNTALYKTNSMTRMTTPVLTSQCQTVSGSVQVYCAVHTWYFKVREAFIQGRILIQFLRVFGSAITRGGRGRGRLRGYKVVSKANNCLQNVGCRWYIR